MKFLIANKCK